MIPDFRNQQRDALLEITRAITKELDLDRVPENIQRISVDMLNGQAGFIALRGADAAPRRIAASVGVALAFRQAPEPVLRGLIGRRSFTRSVFFAPAAIHHHPLPRFVHCIGKSSASARPSPADCRIASGGTYVA